MQILVQWMTRRAASKVGRFVDEHGVHGLDVVADETSHAVEDSGKLAVAEIVRRVIVADSDE